MSREAPNTLLLHQYHLGELDDAEQERVREAIEQDPDTRRRYQAIQAAESAFSVQSLPPWLAEEPANNPAGWRRWLAIGGPVVGLLVVAAVTLLFVGIPTGTTTVDGGLGGDEIRFKGELPALEVWVGTEAGLRPLRSGERVSEGTRVNLVFDARGHRLATLAGQDGTGSVEIYDTLDVAGQTGLIEAPFALELDDAPGPQAFFLLVHDEPLAADIIQDHVRDDTGELTRVVLDKE